MGGHPRRGHSSAHCGALALRFAHHPGGGLKRDGRAAARQMALAGGPVTFMFHVVMGIDLRGQEANETRVQSGTAGPPPVT